MNRTNKTLIAALIVSLLLNFAAAGYIGVRLVRDHTLDSILDHSTTDVRIPKELKDAFRKALRSDRAGLLKALRELGVARDKLHKTLVAESLDVPALEAAQAEVRTATVGLISHLQGALRVAVTELPQDVRQSIPEFRIGRDLAKKLEDAAQ